MSILSKSVFFAVIVFVGIIPLKSYSANTKEPHVKQSVRFEAFVVPTVHLSVNLETQEDGSTQLAYKMQETGRNAFVHTKKVQIYSGEATAVAIGDIRLEVTASSDFAMARK